MKKVAISSVLLVIMIALPSFAASIPDFPFVHAKGKAEKELPPDTAKMTFCIKAFDAKSSNAVDTIQARTAEVVRFVTAQGFNKGSLISYELNKKIVREQKDFIVELKILGYEVERNFELTFDDLSKYEVVAKTLFTMDNVSEIQTSFDRKDRAEIEASLISVACADAKRTATAMASGLGVALGTVHCVSSSYFVGLGATFGLGEEDYEDNRLISHMTGGGDNPDFFYVPSTIKFKNCVNVLFKLEKK